MRPDDVAQDVAGGEQHAPRTGRKSLARKRKEDVAVVGNMGDTSLERTAAVRLPIGGASPGSAHVDMLPCCYRGKHQHQHHQHADMELARQGQEEGRARRVRAEGVGVPGNVEKTAP